MKNILLIFTLLFLSGSGWAHNPLTAKVELNTKVPEISQLGIYLSQTGLHQALSKYYDTTDLSTISTTEYKKLAVQYLKDHIHLVADGTPLVIGEGGIKLGNHQTDFRFLIKNFPKNIRNLQANIDIGKENGNHHTVFSWLQKEGKSKVVLSERNQYQTVLNVEQVIAESNNNYIGKMVGGGLALLLVLALFGRLYTSRKKKGTNKFDKDGMQVSTTS